MPNKIQMLRYFSKLPKRTVWIILVVVVLVSLGGIAYYQILYKPAQQQTDEPSLQTATVRRGDIVLYASGSGTLAPAAEASFGFGVSGQVKEVYVNVGDVVEAGQLLAELDNITQEIQYTQAKRELAEMTSPFALATAEQAIAVALLEVDSAYGHLAYLISPEVLHWEEEIAKVEQELAAARKEAETSPSTEPDQKVQELESKLDLFKEKLDGNWIYYEEQYVPDNFTLKDRATGKKYVSYPSDASIAQARAEYALTKATVIEAEYYLAALKGEEVPEDATGSNLTEMENAQLSQQSAENNLNATRLIAPFSGTIMSLDFVVGDSVGTSAVLIIADLSQKYLEIFLDETDWGNIAVSYDAEVIFDALPNQVFTGKVTQVDPGLYTSENTSVVRGLVLLDETSDGLNLPIGTGAAVDIIGGRADNAILVPVDSLRETSPGEYAIFVIEDDKPKLRMVEIGLKDLFSAEVLSGLEPGEVVSTGLVDTE
ncbi:MAG: efflux RND transporter periplasmic adaptor subunit [Anaerolineae bacterium]|nr:efflux RND transporter periplasmic adaptor subunit [Anaerolineae bacterium]MDK1081336.1 efflux RND transporter periplasmic adaptor subunit [Anaerolineae bacterium]